MNSKRDAVLVRRTVGAMLFVLAMPLVGAVIGCAEKQSPSSAASPKNGSPTAAAPAAGDRVAELLAMPPAENADQRKTWQEKLAKLTADDLGRLMTMLQPVDKGGDEAARRVLHGATVLAGSAERTDLWNALNEASKRFLQTSAAGDASAFVIAQVAITRGQRADAGPPRPSDTPRDSHSPAATRLAALVQASRAPNARPSDDSKWLLTALSGADAEAREAVVECWSATPNLDKLVLDGDKTLVDLMQSADARTREALLRIIALRGAPVAADKLVPYLTDADPAVRAAAVRAVARVTPDGGFVVLIKYAETADDAGLAAVRRELARNSSAGANPRLTAMIRGAAPRVQALLLGVLRDRFAVDQLPTVLEIARSASDPVVRVAAADAIGVLGAEANIPDLLALLGKAQTDPERAAIVDALAMIAKRPGTSPQAAAAIVSAIKPDDEQQFVAMLGVLGKIGGEQAWGAVRKAIDDPRPAVKDAAYRALGDWPETARSQQILEIAKFATDERQHVLALRSAIRLAGADEKVPASQRVINLSAIGKTARRSEEKRIVISKLGEIGDSAAVAVLLVYIADPELTLDAQAALLSSADKLAATKPEISRMAVQSVQTKGPTLELQQRAEEVLKRVVEYEDFVVDWLAAGPYQQTGVPGRDLLDKEMGPELSQKGINWTAAVRGGDPGRLWYVDLSKQFAGPDRAVYLWTQVYSMKVQDARFELGSDDGIKVWLNGAVVHTNNASRGCERASDVVPVKLKAGWNAITLKVTNISGGFGACLRVRGPAGEHVEGLRITLDPQPVK